MAEQFSAIVQGNWRVVIPKATREILKLKEKNKVRITIEKVE